MREHRTIDTTYGLREWSNTVFISLFYYSTTVSTHTNSLPIHKRQKSKHYLHSKNCPFTQNIDREQNNKVPVPLAKDSIIATVTGGFKFSREKTSSNKASTEEWGNSEQWAVDSQKKSH